MEKGKECAGQRSEGLRIMNVRRKVLRRVCIEGYHI